MHRHINMERNLEMTDRSNIRIRYLPRIHSPPSSSPRFTSCPQQRSLAKNPNAMLIIHHLLILTHPLNLQWAMCLLTADGGGERDAHTS